jgi:amino-acid N-acetyltransferase
MRQAKIQDVTGIVELIRPLEKKGVLVKRSREHLEMEVHTFSVIERDGMIIGCAALYPYPEHRMGELACLALHTDYRGENRGDRLLDYLEQKALSLRLHKLFALTTQTAHWFREHGFEPATVDDLPPERRATYNPQRNSKILIKLISS